MSHPLSEMLASLGIMGDQIRELLSNKKIDNISEFPTENIEKPYIFHHMNFLIFNINIVSQIRESKHPHLKGLEKMTAWNWKIVKNWLCNASSLENKIYLLLYHLS